MKAGCRISLLFALALAVFPLQAQDAGTFEAGTALPEQEGFLRYINDTTVVTKVYKDINDYELIGVNYGVSLSRMSFNPAQKQSSVFSPMYVSVTFTKYMKMFQYMPFFGWQLGLAYGSEGYRFRKNKETGTTYMVEGATEARFKIVEMPFLLHMHFDSDVVKFMANIGMYAGYRLGIERTGPSVTDGLQNAFADYDKRWDYGLQGGAGIGFIFDPFEFHLNASLRYSWSSIYAPDSSPSIYNQYYYRFAYPFDIMFTAGIHFQLSRRTGWTGRKLKAKAREIVENGWDLEIVENINAETESKDRQ